MYLTLARWAMRLRVEAGILKGCEGGVVRVGVLLCGCRGQGVADVVCG